MNIAARLPTVELIARDCSLPIRDKFYHELTFDAKSCSTDLVTEVDKEVEKALLEKLSAAFPNEQIIGEESSSTNEVSTTLTDEPTWAVDPLDGTTNFIHHYPSVCVSIGLIVNQKPVLGVIYNPITEEMYTGLVGTGAKLNGKPVTVSKSTNNLRDSLIVTEFGYVRGDPTRSKPKVELVGKLVDTCRGVRCTGSAALDLCMVARGACQAYVEQGIHVWDMAAGCALVESAGGICCDPIGGPSVPVDLMSRRCLAAANSSIATQLYPLLSPIEYKTD